VVLASPAAAWLFLAGLAALPKWGDAADVFVRAAYVVAWVLCLLIGARLYQQSLVDRRRCRDAEDVALHTGRVAELTGALAHARTASAAIEAALQEPLHALHADAGLVSLIGRHANAADHVRTVGYRKEERELRLASDPPEKSPAADAVGRGALVVVESARQWATEYPGFPRGSFEAIAAVPLLIGSRVFAVVQLEFRAPRTFSKADREYLETLGIRAAQALDRTWELEAALNARTDADDMRGRVEKELAERQSAERALRTSEARYRALVARTSRLHALASALSEAATLQAVARAVVSHGREVLGAAGGEVEMLVDGGSTFEIVYTDGRDGAASAGTREPAEPGLCATEAVRTRSPVFVTSFDQWQESFARSAALAADGGYVSSATLPLIVNGLAVGVLVFHFTAPVNFDDDYRDLLASVARHCTQAVERARLYEAANAARADAVRANRDKDELVAIVSHELRTPLNAILGWTSMLQQGVMDEHSTARALHSIAENATRQARLVEDLLDFSRLQSGRMTLEMTEVDIRAVLKGVIESMIPVAAAGGVHLEIGHIPAACVRGDARRLEQIFLNLLANAVKFTPSEGRVALSAIANAEHVEVRVTDTGPGIDPSFLPHMFEAFRQADGATTKRYGGVGLGLSIAKELAEAHDGRIEAESPGIGRGATFVVTLPVHASSAKLDGRLAGSGL
jgi:signal transduction histidine kinase